MIDTRPATGNGAEARSLEFMRPSSAAAPSLPVERALNRLKANCGLGCGGGNPVAKSRTIAVGVRLAVCVFLTTTLPAQSADKGEDPDKALLRQAQVGIDQTSLVKFFMEFPAHVDRQHLGVLVRQLGDKRFEARERASRELAACGQAALVLLRECVESPDREIARRAKACIEDIQRRQPIPGVEEAVVRLLLQQRPAGTVTALLRYLPFASDADVEEDIWFGLDSLATPGAKPDPALKAALTDRIAARRAVAACILGRRSEPDVRAAVRKLLADPEPTVRLRAAQGLLAGREKDVLPTLIALLGEPSVELSWQAEELLHWVAGKGAPDLTIGAGDSQSRQRCRAAWEQWRQRQGAKVDLTRWEHDPRRPGLLLVSGSDAERTQGRVWLCGCDGKPRWQIKTGVVCDMSLLSSNRMLVAEFRSNRITECSLDGQILWQHKTFAWSCQRLPNGNTLFLDRERIGEITPRGAVVNVRRCRTTGGGSPSFSFRLRSGRILCWYDDATTAPGYKCLIECDPVTGQEQKRVTLAAGAIGYCAAGLADGRYLLVGRRPDRVFEVDSAGKVVWQYSVENVGGFPIRLRNGNTLLTSDCSGNSGRLLEMDRAGKVVWETFTAESLGRARLCLGLVRLGFLAPRPASFDLNSLPSRLAGLKSKDVVVRRGTLAVLRDSGPRAAPLIPALIEALQDVDFEVRGSATRLLVKLGPRAVPELLTALKDSRPAIRASAAGLLSECEAAPEVAFPALLAALDDESASVRDPVIRSLGLLCRHRKETLPIIVRVLKDRDGEVRLAAIQIMGVLGPTAAPAVPHLLAFLKDRDLDTRCATISTLGRIGALDKRVMPVLIGLLNDKQREPAVRIAATCALSSMGAAARDAVPDLLKVANYKPAPTGTPDMGVQGSAALAVEYITRDKGVAPTLATILRDQKAQAPLRRKTFQALRRMGSDAREAVPALIEILKEPATRLDLDDATATLAVLGSDAACALADCITSGAKATRRRAFQTLQRMGTHGEDAIPAVAEALTDPDPAIRALAWNALPRMGSDAVAVLVRFLKKGDVATRCRALDALGEMGSAAKEAIPALVRATDDSTESVRNAAARALEKIRP